MGENGEFDGKPTKTKADEWFARDQVASEIRNISKRIIDTYEELGSSGDESVGLVDKSKVSKVQAELSQAFHDLEEFDVKPGIHVGKEPEFFKNNPRTIAEFAGGQLLNLRNIPLTTDMERNNSISGMGLENMDVTDPDQQWPPEVQNMRRQVGIIGGAQKLLRLKK